VNHSKASIAWRISVGGGGERQATPPKGARGSTGALMPDAVSKTLHASGGRFTPSGLPKITLTVITVSTATSSTGNVSAVGPNLR
jgi:hypothetical protein